MRSRSVEMFLVAFSSAECAREGIEITHSVVRKISSRKSAATPGNWTMKEAMKVADINSIR